MRSYSVLKNSKKILVTGACGQIGTDLTLALRERYGNSTMVATGHKTKPSENLLYSGPLQFIDCRDINVIAELVRKHNVGTIYHLAAILSAVAEAKSQLAWETNINGLYNVLQVARECKCAVFIPSSIAVFAPTAPKENIPQETILRPNTMYGVTKVTGELLCDYYWGRFGVDTRSVRFPGLISYRALPGGGTTDYAVEIFYEAIKHRRYTCFLKAQSCLPMMYMPDALKAAIGIMEADSSKLNYRNAYNVTAMSFTPEDIASEIKKHIPDFVMEYDVDPVRQAIADSWPNSVDDSAAREEWGWKPEYNLATMTEDMLRKLADKLKIRI